MKTNESFADKILDLYKTTAYQKLNAYYQQTTIFSILGVERNENRHSAFLSWLLNPASSHGLKEIPLRKFLALAATKAEDKDKCYYYRVREHLISGNYSMRVESIKTEQSIIGLANGKTESFINVVEQNDSGTFKNDAQNRFDLWMLLHITFVDEKDQEQQWSLPVVIENKIYSSEGRARDEEKAQTVRYHRAVNILKNIVCPSPNYCQPLLIFLNPADVRPTHNAFIQCSYQELLDHIIQPCSLLSQTASADVRTIMEGYIRNLSCPSKQEGKKDYSILAIAETESDDLKAIFWSEAYRKAFSAIYPKEAQTLLGADYEEVDDLLPLMEQFWNANEDLFKIVLYNQFKDDKNMDVVRNIVKESNRDNTRYHVGLAPGKWMNVDGKPAPKSEASFLIFKAYCEQWKKDNPREKLHIENLRNAFEVALNSYYHNRFLQYLFYDFEKDVVFDVKEKKYFGQAIVPESDTWDFYWDDNHVLPIDEGEVRSVKMWRKSDFDKLVKKAGEYGIVVEPAE